MSLGREAAELLETLTSLGVVVEPRGERLAVRFAENRRPEVEKLRPRLEAMKPELLTVLAGEQARPSVREEYHRRATEALRGIGRLGDPREALAWLEQAQPARWRWLLYVLPDHLDGLWESGAGLDTFQQALDTWVVAHQKAVKDWRRAVTSDSDR
jgi:hypothetical protein